MKLSPETITASESCRDLNIQDMVSVLSRHHKVWSWGARGWTNYKGLVLAFRVSGNKFKGNVALMCNADDLMDIHFCSNCGNLKDKIEDVYIGDIIEYIDEYVEKIDTYAY